MADLSTPKLIVEEGVRIMSVAEDRARKGAKTIAELVAVISAGKAQGWIGALEEGALKAKARSLAGAFADVERDLFILHRRLTDICMANNVDLPSVQGGGDR